MAALFAEKPSTSHQAGLPSLISKEQVVSLEVSALVWLVWLGCLCVCLRMFVCKIAAVYPI
jgi:hypothetical protein